jgi:hypothetical protein
LEPTGADNCQVKIRRHVRQMSWEGYGNGKAYIAARLDRDGFKRLAALVRSGKITARWAKDIAKTVPQEHLDAVIDRAELLGPRCPEWWEWQFALSLEIADDERT